MVVLGYSLIRTDQLPPATELKTLIDAPDLKGAIADQLAEAGFVTEEQLGRLQVCVPVILFFRGIMRRMIWQHLPVLVVYSINSWHALAERSAPAGC